MSEVQNWIGTLVDPDYDGPTSRDPDAMDTHFSFKKVKTDSYATPPEPSFSAPAQPTPPPPPMNPPPPLPTAQPQAAFLPLFNQTATQRRLVVEYPASFSGPAHAGRWTVKCVGAYHSTLGAARIRNRIEEWTLTNYCLLFCCLG